MINNETHKIDYYKNGNIQCEKYYFDGKLHNENGPAAIYYYENGNKYCEEYYINNNFHNENGPAEIYYYKNGNKQHEEYYINDKLHNESGPAIVKYHKDGSIEHKEYYIDGEFVITNEEVEKYINSTKPIRIKNINKLKILYNICKTRNLEDKMNEISSKLLLKELQK